MCEGDTFCRCDHEVIDGVTTTSDSSTSTTINMTEEEYVQFIRDEYCRVVNKTHYREMFYDFCDICGIPFDGKKVLEQ